MSKLASRNLIIFSFLLLLVGSVFIYDNIGPIPESGEKSLQIVPETTSPQSVQSFGKVTVTADLFLDGKAENIDSPEFFENGEQTLLLVSGKKNDLVEIWQYPFANELEPLKRSSLPNGLAVDQEQNLLFIGDSEKELVEAFSLPDLQSLRKIGNGTLKSGETNLDILTLPNGKRIVYVTDSDQVHGFDTATGELRYTITPQVESIEEVLADSFYQIIYVPEENGGTSARHQGGAVTAYKPDGQPFLRNGTSVFGQGIFAQDGEGITLYTCRGADGKDNGQGFIIVSDQRTEINDFEFFDRVTWQHLGTLRIENVSFTDGITVSSLPLPNYPKGIFAGVNNDTNTALVSWEKIEGATGISCP